MNIGTQQRHRVCNSLGCTPEDDCDDKCFQAGHNDFFYLQANSQKVCGQTSAVKMTATDAFDTCRSLSGELPMPVNSVTLSNIRELRKSQTSSTIWLGVYRKESNGQWLSVNDGKPFPIDTYPIGTGQDNDHQMYLGTTLLCQIIS